MLNFNAYSLKDLQNFKALLQQCEQKSITDTRFVKESIVLYIQKQIKDRIDSTSKHIKYKKDLPVCSKCSTGKLEPLIHRDENGKIDKTLKIVGCRNCRYSKIVEDYNDYE